MQKDDIFSEEPKDVVFVMHCRMDAISTHGCD